MARIDTVEDVVEELRRRADAAHDEGMLHTETVAAASWRGREDGLREALALLERLTLFPTAAAALARRWRDEAAVSAVRGPIGSHTLSRCAAALADADADAAELLASRWAGESNDHDTLPAERDALRRCSDELRAILGGADG